MDFEQHFGASLYVPGTHPDLGVIAAGIKLEGVRNLIFCMEDAVADHELETAYANLARALPGMQRRPGFARYLRPRDPQSLLRVLAMPGISAIDGFVLPKFGAANLSAFLDPLLGTAYSIMPTLETVDAFDERLMRELCACLLAHPQLHRIVALRIGGNDLLSLLGMRRPRAMTIYDTPVGDVISSLVRVFKPAGFQLTSPVFEYFEDEHTLARELQRDLAHGLCGKTAIHPCQVELIEHYFQVSDEDVALARLMVDGSSAGIFKMHGAMCEPATHRRWAQEVLARSRQLEGKLGG